MLRLLIILSMLLGFTLAQDNQSDLRQEARRLTIEAKISELSVDLQSEARELFSRAQALREPMQAMRTKMLEVYVAELGAGKAPYLARAIARDAVAEERLALLPELAPLIQDMRAFARENPEVAPLFRERRENFRPNRLN